MNKFALFLLIAVSSSVPVGLNCADSGKNPSVFINPIVTPPPLAEIERIDLDKTEALYACSCYGFVSRFPNGCGLDENGVIKKDNLLIKVKPVVRNPKNTRIFYEYAVTGGRILGQGNEVVWNLEGVRPGTYTITASIKGARGVSAETRAESVRVRECICDCPCVCPELSITANDKVRASESLVFSAKVLGGTVTDVTYDWTISQGEIVSGQGTPQIKVKTTQEMTGDITATVEIGGYGLCEECPRTDSKIVAIVK